VSNAGLFTVENILGITVPVAVPSETEGLRASYRLVS
jgi:hypothetical protein